MPSHIEVQPRSMAPFKSTACNSSFPPSLPFAKLPRPLTCVISSKFTQILVASSLRIDENLHPDYVKRHRFVALNSSISLKPYSTYSANETLISTFSSQPYLHFPSVSDLLQLRVTSCVPGNSPPNHVESEISDVRICVIIIPYLTRYGTGNDCNFTFYLMKSISSTNVNSCNCSDQTPYQRAI